LAGLAGNPRLIHCTILAVSRIYFQFQDIFPQVSFRIQQPDKCQCCRSKSLILLDLARTFLRWRFQIRICSSLINASVGNPNL
jgi:hypothetical protein